MKSLDFEKVSIADARKELEGQIKRADASKAIALRAPMKGSLLLETTVAWINGLPEAVRPVALARAFPRIANSIAELWHRVARCESYLDGLVVDERGDRTGFPQEIAQELAELRSYYSELHPANRTAWDLVERDK